MKEEPGENKRRRSRSKKNFISFFLNRVDAPPCFLPGILRSSWNDKREEHKGKKRRRERISRESFSTLVKESVFSLSLFLYPRATTRDSFSCFHDIATFLVLDDTLILFVSDRIREQDRKFLNERRNNNHATEQPRNLTWETFFLPRKWRGFSRI